MKKRFLAGVLIVIMLFALTACGNKETGNSSVGSQSGSDRIKNPASKEGVFKVTDLDVDFGVENVNYYNFNNIKVIDDVLYAVVHLGFNNGNSQRYITMDASGNVLSNIVLQEQIWENIVNEYPVVEELETEDTEETLEENSTEEEVTEAAVAVTNEKVALAAASGAVTLPMLPMPELPAEGTAGEDSSATEETEQYEEYNNIYSYQILDDGKLVYVEMYEKYLMETWELVENRCTMVTCEPSGEKISSIEIDPKLEEGQYFYVNSLIPGSNNHMYVMCDGFHFDVDLTSGEAKKIEANDLTRDIYSVAFYKNGYPVVNKWNDDYTKQSYVAVDLAKGVVVEEVTLPDSIMNYNFFEGTNSGYDLVLAGNNAVYGYKYGNEDMTLLMDYVNSDLATYRLRNISFTDPEHFVALYNDIINGESRIASFVKVAPEDVPDKEGLTMATYYTDSEVTSRVIEFNKASDKYRILIHDYSQYSTYDDYNAGITRLDNDIISGKIPDILYLQENIPVEKYAAKGMLADFYELIEADETLQLEDYCTNVFKAYETEGKLYQLPTKFYIMTVLGKTSIFGSETGLTWDELDSVLAQYPEAKAFTEMTKEGILRNAMTFNYAQLVDQVTGDCYFNTDSFKKILEFANTFPAEINYDELYNDEEYWNNYQLQYMEDRTLLMQSGMYSFNDIWRNAYTNFMEDVTPIGYPTMDGNGNVVSAMSSYAISAKSASVEGAWEFVKGFISEEEQMKSAEQSYSWGLPVLKKALEATAELIKARPYYLDEKGEKVEYDDYIYVNGEEILLEPATDAEVQKWLNFIYSVDRKAVYNYEQAMSIILEDAAGYFSGDKTVDEVAGIIQSRMNIFISENQ